MAELLPKPPAGYRLATDEEKKLWARFQSYKTQCEGLAAQIAVQQAQLEDMQVLCAHHQAKAPAVEDKGGLPCIKV